MQSISDSFLRPANEVWGKVILLHLSVILFTGGSTWAGTPLGQVHPLAGTPPGQVTALGRYTPLAGTPPGQVHPLGRYTPKQVHPLGRYPHPSPLGRYTPRLGRYTPRQVHPPGQVHPLPRSSACWEIRATSGWYASYWNSFLFPMRNYTRCNR